MTIRKWFYLFWTTLAIGTVVGILTGLTMQLTDPEAVLSGKAIGFTILSSLLIGSTISVLSQMGFFAYLIVRHIFMGMIPKKWIWDYVQIFTIIVVLVDLVYLRYVDSAHEGSFSTYFLLPAFILIVSVVVAYAKVKATNTSAWIPTLFFMIVLSTLEAIPALRLGKTASTIFMVIPLLACNAWQILILHKVLNTNKEPQ
ncbi:KinB-signaling pathway activation protein [Paenibacillus sp. YYML68]|uniref:KinB-signaling pathway activation protein n=1 Tax=Paenibacillus sp. YYML68 TaxID=2909250 RepID=UPI00249355BA|nr:KinB-signaling pathway activation protein [Paenibacillus sp. YYML68]